MRYLRRAGWPVAAAVVVATALLGDRNPHTTYGGLGPAWRWALAVAAVAIVVPALVPPAARRAAVARWLAATAALWLAGEWAGWTSGPTAARVAAHAVSALAPAAALAAALALHRALRAERAGGARRGALDDRARHVVLRVGVAGLAAVVAARLLADPFRDAGCARICVRNPWAPLGAEQVVGAAAAVGTGAVLLAAVVAAGLATAGGLARPREAARAVLGLGCAVLLGGLVAPLVLDALGPERPADPAARAAFLVSVAGALLCALGLALARVKELRLRSGLGRLVEGLRDAPQGSLEGVLARALDDPGLRLGFWSDLVGGYLDAGGAPRAMDGRQGRVVTAIQRRGEPVAALDHDARVDSARIQRALGPAVRLRLHNEQLRAAALAELAELRTSRLRIVEAADTEERRLERDLHDGAQQRLVAMALLLRLLGPGDADAAVVARAQELLAAALEELRRLASGIHPATLAYGGLRAAVDDLALRSGLAVDVGELPPERHPPAIESAAYLVVAEALADARRSGAVAATVRVVHEGAALVVAVTDDGPADRERRPLRDLDDRVQALDGLLEVSASGVRLTLPSRAPHGRPPIGTVTAVRGGA